VNIINNINLDKLKIVLVTILALFLGFQIIGFVKYGGFPGSVEYYRKLYKTALEYQENEEYKNAYKTFNKITPRYAAYDAVLFHQAKCAAALGDEKTAIEKLKLLILKYPSSILVSQADYNLGQAYLRIKDYKSAKKQFKKVISKHSDTDYAIGSYYYLGQIAKDDNLNTSVKYWLKYLELSPKGRFSLDCIDELVKSKAVLNTNDKFLVGKSLYENKNYEEALKYLRAVPISKSWFYIANCYKNLGKKQIALKLFKEGISKYPGSISKEDMRSAMNSYVSLNNDPADKSWSELISITENSYTSSKDYAIYRKALVSPKKDAIKLNQIIAYTFSKGDFASDALWKIFWHEFSARNYKQALKIGKAHMQLYPDKNASPKMLFWMGKLYERMNSKQAAIKCYNDLLRLYPDNYYAFRANGRKLALENGYDPGWRTSRNTAIHLLGHKPDKPYSYAELEKNFNKLIAELLEIEDFDLIMTLPEKDLFIESWIKYRQGVRSKSIVLARDGMEKLKDKPDADDKRWQLIYPLYFVDEINRYATYAGVDALLALSLMREESYFNHLAVSSSNARGLMQLLPGTAKDIARWKNLGQVSDFGLFTPETNIKLGTAYLRYTEDKLYGITVFAVAAYNGGPGAVQSWLGSIQRNDMDEFIENIPYDQTRDYVKKVYASYWNYKRIYKL